MRDATIDKEENNNLGQCINGSKESVLDLSINIWDYILDQN